MDGSEMSAIGSFILDESYGFTQAGVARIDESIMVYVWAILGDQTQVRSSNVGEIRKQFLVNVEAEINSEVDLPDLKNRYQDALQYARSKLDFVLGSVLYLIPSDMDLNIGTINGYNNLIQKADEDIKNIHLGQNDNINDEPEIIQPPPDDPSIQPTPDEATTDEPASIQPDEPEIPQLTHDETKLVITLSAVIGGSFLIWYLKS